MTYFRSQFSQQAADESKKSTSNSQRQLARNGRLASMEAEPTPYDVIYTENMVRLRQYESNAAEKQEIPVVFAYAFINTPAILDLSQKRSVIRQFLERGFDVYVVDWGRPSNLDRHLSLGDYVCRYFDNCVDAARKQSEAETVHTIGASTGAPLAAMYTALNPENVETLGLQVPSLNFDTETGLMRIRELITSVDPEKLVETFGKMPSELLDLGFLLRKPANYTIGKPIEILENIENETYHEQNLRIARWVADSPDMAGETYRQFVEELLKANKLFENRLSLLGTQVELGNIDMPVVLILGEDDQFVPRNASVPFLDVVPSEDTAVFEFPTGHVGTFVDQEIHENWWPDVCEWFTDRTPTEW